MALGYFTENPTISIDELKGLLSDDISLLKSNIDFNRRDMPKLKNMYSGQIKNGPGTDLKSAEYWVLDKLENFDLDTDKLSDWWGWKFKDGETRGDWFVKNVYPHIEGLSMFGFRALKSPGAFGKDINKESIWSLAEDLKNINPRIMPKDFSWNGIESLPYPAKPSGLNGHADKIDYEELMLTLYFIVQAIKTKKLKTNIQDIPKLKVNTPGRVTTIEEPKIAIPQTTDVPKTRSKEWLPIEVMRSNEEPVSEYLPEPTLDAEDGWLSPDGKLYPCGMEQHNSLQYDLEEHLGVEDLEKAGWIKLSGGKIYATGQKIGWYLDDETNNPPTQSQLNTIFDWCQMHHEDLPWWYGKES
jgi:hypothetical protein